METESEFADALRHAGLHENVDAFVKLYGEAPDAMTWAVCMSWYRAGVWDRASGASCTVERCPMVPKKDDDDGNQ